MLRPGEREKMLRAYSIGPKMVHYLEKIGIETLAELKDENAQELALRIDEMLGKRHMNKLGIEALENLIAHALSEDTVQHEKG